MPLSNMGGRVAGGVQYLCDRNLVERQVGSDFAGNSGMFVGGVSAPSRQMVIPSRAGYFPLIMDAQFDGLKPEQPHRPA